MVFTCAASKPGQHPELGAVAEIIVCGTDEVDLSEARRILTERGLSRVLCEGGPSLLADLARTGNVTELCLSIAPQFVGPGAPRLAGGPAWAGVDPRPLQLEGLLEEDGALFARYRFAG